MGGEAKPGFVDRAMLADAGQHILQLPPLGRVIQHVAHRDERQPGPFGDERKMGEAAGIVATIEVMRREVGTAGKIRRHPCCEFDHIIFIGRQHDEDLSLAMGDDIGVVEMAFALGRAPLSQGQEARQAAISGAVLRVGEEAGAVGEIEPDADDEADIGNLCGVMGAHQAGDAVPIGDRDRLVAERRGGRDQFVGMRGAAQEREIAGDLQFGVARTRAGARDAAVAAENRRSRLAHRSGAPGADRAGEPVEGFRRQLRHRTPQAKTPCRNQRGGGSPGKPARNSQKRRPSSSSTR